MDRSEGRIRPWLQFSLRTLFILTIGIALGFAPLKVWELTAPAKLQVALDTKLLEVPHDLLAELGLTSLPDGLTAQRIADLEQLMRQIETLKSRGAKVMVEPTLSTLSGKRTKFNVGGDVPIPVTYEDGQTTIEYREVGIGVEFLPTIQRNGRISLGLDTSVSRVEPQPESDASAVPKIESVSSHTEFELADGGTLLVGGFMLDPQDNGRRSAVVVVATVRVVRR